MFYYIMNKVYMLFINQICCKSKHLY